MKQSTSALNFGADADTDVGVKDSGNCYYQPTYTHFL